MKLLTYLLRLPNSFGLIRGAGRPECRISSMTRSRRAPVMALISEPVPQTSISTTSTSPSTITGGDYQPDELRDTELNGKVKRGLIAVSVIAGILAITVCILLYLLRKHKDMNLKTPDTGTDLPEWCTPKETEVGADNDKSNNRAAADLSEFNGSITRS
ncbi:hypothetical protein BKA66DRAFT_444027 [Pyrenochaeta sp. MPI-SDFR-AT-0127]|nr:hypothetical protein BKA66DRAFT_444027 [Pyrenochaeta sp. MPI-SDFR-AT-0127]